MHENRNPAVSDRSIEWNEGECGPDYFEAEFNFYVAQVYPAGTLDEDGRECRDEEAGYFWRVDSTSAISEWPEVVNCGFAPTVAEAKSLAEACLLRQEVRTQIEY